MALDWLLRPVPLVFVTIFILQSMSISSISETEALIKLKNSFTNATALSSWVNGSTPCKGDNQWNGLLCSNGIVIGLRLEKMGLSGKIDVDALVDISGLRSVSFARNSFSGTIPELSRLGYLKSIFLSGNQFSGEIPSDFFLKMVSLKKLWLSDNKFSGDIPSSLINLSNLLELHLENNEFSGNIPSIKQSTLTTFNVSNNKLTGEIPTGLEKFSLSSFQGNSALCGEKIGKECTTSKAISTSSAAQTNSGSNNATIHKGYDTTSAKDDKEKDIVKTTSAGIITLGILLISVAAVLLFKLRRKDKGFDVGGKDNGDHPDEAVEVQVTMPVRSKDIEANKKVGANRKGSNPNKGGATELVIVNDEKGVFGLQDLMKSAAEVLGNGGLGASYKALMNNGGAVVVKRMREMNALGKDSFDAEVRQFGRLKHPNILAPLAFHYRKDEKLLIYEYMTKGSLLYLLHGDMEPSQAGLNWSARLKIVVGIARGLGYLHTELASCDLPHGNLKSSNIFLSHDDEPVISEFGFNQLTNLSVGRQALLAYKAPEAAQFGVSPKCDVYCLGLIILEILTGKVPSQYLNNDKEGIDLVQWVETSIAHGRESELIDPEIASSTNLLREMIALLHIGTRCAESNPAQRLDLREAIARIEEISVDSDNRTMHVLPSLRDGYGDAPPFNPYTSTKEGYGESSRSGRGASYSFTDSSQFSFASPGSTFLCNDS